MAYHLFFVCDYVMDVMKLMGGKLRLSFKPRPWDRWIDWFLKVSTGKALEAQFRRRAHAAAVYFVWQECCRRTHQQQARSPQSLAEVIVASSLGV